MALRVGAVLTLVAGSLVATATSAFAASNLVTLSPSHGPSGGGYPVVLTETVATFGSSTGPYTVQFNVAGTCPTTSGIATALSGSGTVSAGIAEVTGVPKPAGQTLSVTTPASLALPAGTTGGTFSVCVYDTGAASALIANADASFTLNPDATPSQTTGGTGGNYAIGITSTSAPFTTNPQVQFQAKATGGATACATTARGAAAPSGNGSGALTGGVIPVPAASITVNATNKLTVMVPPTLVQPTTPSPVFTGDYFICVYDASGSPLIAENSSVAPFTVSGNTVLSQTSGSTAGGNTVTLSAPSGTIFATGTQNVRLTTVACPSTLSAADGSASVITPSSTRYVSANKVAFTLPTTGLPSSNTSYYVCAYNGAGSSLVASAYGQYTVGQVPTVTTVSPATGPAQGGSTITVNGTNFPVTGMTATLGGTALTAITVGGTIAGGVGTQFTATVPAHSPGGPFALAVTTTGGTVTINSVFTFTNGITVTPKTAPNSGVGPTGLDIQGVGFADLNFGTTYATNSSSAHVYLVKGVYNGGTVATATAVKPNPQTSECIDVLVIGDTELLCNLYLGGNLNAAPTPTTRTLSSCANYPSASATAPLPTPVASTFIGPATSTVTTCTFTQADVGNTITAGASGAAIAANATVITAVNNGVATLSKQSAVAITSATTPITTSTQRVMTDGVTSTGAATLGAGTVANSTTFFTTADVNKVVTGPGIPAGTYIVSVAAGVATLSNQATATTAANGVTGFTIFNPAPVPNGTYTVTIVSNGAPGAQLQSTYYQTIISSGSTFTVSDYLH
ncbi:IPT/TIG domain-containing protein [Dactylosporangium sp. NPDC051485]|uniref:beta strand repeat-containing protein n=1 Tax=Dactylosporangium sp. NPDC051485 TaxID=3154846 RepID=UPI00341235BC